MIQRNLQLISVKRNEITTLCSVRNHFFTDGLKTMQAYMKSNCIAAGSTIIPWMMIFQPFCKAWDVAEFPKKKKDLIKTMILLKIETHFLKNHVLQHLCLLPIFLGQNKLKTTKQVAGWRLERTENFWLASFFLKPHFWGNTQRTALAAQQSTDTLSNLFKKQFRSSSYYQKQYNNIHRRTKTCC